MEHRVSYKVYYEDTDCLGVVYYANYLRFMERGRSEFLGAHGRSVADWNNEGVLLVVHALTMKFRKAAVLGDVLDVVSTFTLDSVFRGTFHQRLERAGELVVDAEVQIVCLDRDLQLIRFPEDLRALAAAGQPQG
jgi:tol-pal system-associated acyl-CoA thioesterase